VAEEEREEFTTEITEGSRGNGEEQAGLKVQRYIEEGRGPEMELTERQMGVARRLVEAGFQPVAIPPYESTLILRKGECVGLLKPVANGGFELAVPVTFLIDGNVSVKIKRGKGEVFVWKGKELEATEERLRELEWFRGELVGILEVNGKQ
jgi:hypothetical protein